MKTPSGLVETDSGWVLAATLRGTQIFARHSRSDTTEIYTRVANERLRRVVESIDYGRKIGVA